MCWLSHLQSCWLGQWYCEQWWQLMVGAVEGVGSSGGGGGGSLGVVVVSSMLVVLVMSVV